MKTRLEISKEVIRVSLPLVGGMVGNLIMMFFDRLCLARYSQDTLAASGPAVFTSMTIVLFFTGIVNVSRSYVAQALGRSGLQSAEKEAAIGIMIAICLVAVLALLSPLLVYIPYLSNRPLNIVALENIFMKWAMVFGCVMIMNSSFAAYFSGTGKTKILFYVGLCGQIIDIPMTIGLVFGKFGLPEMGMAGSAIGTLIGSLSMFFVYLFLLPKSVLRGVPVAVQEFFSTRTKSIHTRLRKGLSAGANMGLDELGQTTFVWLVGLLGPVALAANNVNLTLNYLGIIPIIGLGIGCSVLVAKAVGASDFEKVTQIIKTTMLLEMTYVLIITAFQLLMTRQILMPFGLNRMQESIVPLTMSTTHLLWTYSIAFVFSMTGSSALQSFGVTRYALITRVIFMWCLSLPAIFLVGFNGSENPENLKIYWIIGSVFEFAIGLTLMFRLFKAIRGRENQLHIKESR